MIRRLLADTGPLYALADPQDQYHLRANRELDAIQRESVSFLVTQPTLCEAHALVARRLGYNFAARWLDALLESAAVAPASYGDLVEAQRSLERYSDQSIVLHDAIVAAFSRRVNVPVWTFDRHFDVLGVARYPG